MSDQSYIEAGKRYFKLKHNLSGEDVIVEYLRNELKKENKKNDETDALVTNSILYKLIDADVQYCKTQLLNKLPDGSLNSEPFELTRTYLSDLVNLDAVQMLIEKLRTCHSLNSRGKVCDELSDIITNIKETINNEYSLHQHNIYKLHYEISQIRSLIDMFFKKFV